MSLQEHFVRTMPCSRCLAKQSFLDWKLTSSDVLKALQTLGWKNAIRYESTLLTEDWICPDCVTASKSTAELAEEPVNAFNPEVPIAEPAEEIIEITVAPITKSTVKI